MRHRDRISWQPRYFIIIIIIIIIVLYSEMNCYEQETGKFAANPDGLCNRWRVVDVSVWA